MSELVTTTHDRGSKRSKLDHSAVLVSGNKLAVHFGCSRQNVDQLTAQGVIERRADGKFDQDVSRLSYIKHLREQHRHTPRTQADAAHIAAKTEMLQLRLMQARRELVRRDDVDALIGQIAGVTLAALSSLLARCARRGDLAIRRSVERVVFEVRTEIANVCQQMADTCGEPPLDNDA